MIGDKFGKLTVVKIIRTGTVECKCECGNKITEQLHRLLIGHKKSCGCLKFKYKGLSKSKVYQSWDGMKKRCYNPKRYDYKYYGGRGITVCEEWKNDFVSFYNWATSNGYADSLTIDRIDVNGNYEPDNCRWVDMKTQSENRRLTRDRNGKYTSLIEKETVA